MSFLSRTASPEMSRGALIRMTVLLALVAFFADWATKTWAVQVIGENVVPLGIFLLTVVRNDAFAFSSGSGAFSPLAVLAARMTGLVLVVAITFHAGELSRRSAVGFAFVIAGGLGNAFDVLFRDGAVVDFISTGPLMFAVAGQPTEMTFVFNVADIWVFAGIYLLWPLFRNLGILAQGHLARFERRLLARTTS